MYGEEYDFTNILEKPIVIVTFIFLVVFYIIYTYATNSSSSSYSNDDYYNVFEAGNDALSLSEGGSFSDMSYVSSSTFIGIIIFLFSVFVIIKGYQILFNQTITASIEDASTNNPKINIRLNTDPDDDTKYDVPKIITPDIYEDIYDDLKIKQVFNIPINSIVITIIS